MEGGCRTSRIPHISSPTTSPGAPRSVLVRTAGSWLSLKNRPTISTSLGCCLTERCPPSRSLQALVLACSPSFSLPTEVHLFPKLAPAAPSTVRQSLPIEFSPTEHLHRLRAALQRSERPIAGTPSLRMAASSTPRIPDRRRSRAFLSAQTEH